MKNNAPKYSTIGDLSKLLRDLPPLDPEDAAQFAKDLAEIRRNAGMADYKWDEDEADTEKRSSRVAGSPVTRPCFEAR